MMNQLLLEFKNIENSILKIMKSGIKFSVFVSMMSIFILLTYDFVYTSPAFYYIGISLFRTSLFFMVGFVICGFAFNKIQKEIRN